ncbi:uncharacterized protein I206_107486 [Kwoniella pini CBS 10737]|uniref:Uncharacterized protein n=1 Tax=Kwoniella pini CBS 10737 TaxID=1296096 RepID=A0A1B9HXG2_9TREE|nr:uncharacterized protein I206_05815 [Kwoniella pini CBS 10737]OCF47950.1 hypothetical protein I206_05815 [Kwoniella pini CBS 10737]
MGILSHAYGPEWQIKAKNQIDRISVSSNKPNLDSKKDLSETFKIVLEVRQSASEELNDDVQEFLKHNDPEGVFEIVFVGEERENEAVKIWRDRETSLN